jgi:hypothetical protein
MAAVLMHGQRTVISGDHWCTAASGWPKGFGQERQTRIQTRAPLEMGCWRIGHGDATYLGERVAAEDQGLEMELGMLMWKKASLETARRSGGARIAREELGRKGLSF